MKRRSKLISDSQRRAFAVAGILRLIAHTLCSSQNRLARLQTITEE